MSVYVDRIFVKFGSMNREISVFRPWRLALLLLVFGLTFGSEVLAQRQLPLNLYLQHVANDPDKANDPIHLFVKGDVEVIKAKVEDLGGHYKMAFGGYSAVWIPTGQLGALALEPGIERIEAGMTPGQPLLDQSLVNTNVDDIHQGLAPLLQGYEGEGVLVGIIDAGIELNHPDFMDANGNTRVIELWDHTMSYDPQKTPSYGYGQIWDSTEINAGLCPHEDQFIWFGHGSNVSGILTASGNATPGFKGVAPKAEIIVVSSNFSTGGWTGTIADAVDYIYKVADSLDRPCVINASLGTYFGGHDAQDLPALMIDSLIQAKPGRAMVCAAGNAGAEDPFHLGYNVTSDTAFTWFEYNPFSTFGFGSIFFEIWSDTADFNNVFFAMGADKVTGGYSFRGNTDFDNIQNRLNMLVTDSIINNGNVLGIVQTWAEEINGRYRLQIMMMEPDSNQYYFRLMTTGSGRLDLWSGSWLGISDMIYTNLPDSNTFPDIVNYRPPDMEQSMVSSWACSPHVVTVGNYVNRDSYYDVDSNLQTFAAPAGSISDDSSWGPARTGVLKPDVAAPGAVTLTSGKISHLNTLLNDINLRKRVAQGGWHYRNGGTSMASPVVAGIAALFFEQCPMATHQDFLQALQGAAIQDGNTGSTPNFQWGHGKADGFATLVSVLDGPVIDNLNNNGFCPGDSLELFLGSNYSTYDWSSGDTTATVWVDTPGDYWVQVVTDKGCPVTSDTLTIEEYVLPPPAPVSSSDSTAFCEGESITLSVPGMYTNYLWSDSTTGVSNVVNTSGDYFVQYTDTNGCPGVSDTLTVAVIPGPNPVITQIDSTLISTPAVSYQWYYNSFPINGATGASYQATQSGSYYVAVTDTNGCQGISTIYDLYLVGIPGMEVQQPEIFPNPTQGRINVALPPGDWRLTVYNATGQEVLNKQLRNTSIDEEVVLDISGRPQGIYLLNVEGRNHRHTYRIILQ